MHNDTDFNEIKSRLDFIEKKNKHLRIVNIFLVLLVLSIGLVSWQSSSQFFSVLETEKLILRDKNGKERAVLLMDTSANSPKLRFMDNKGNVLNSLGIHLNEPYIRFFVNDTCVFDLSINEDKKPYLQFINGNFKLLELCLGKFSLTPNIILRKKPIENNEDIDYSIFRPAGSFYNIQDGGSINFGKEYYVWERGDRGAESESVESCRITFDNKKEKGQLVLGLYNDNHPFFNMRDSNDTLRTSLDINGFYSYDSFGIMRLALNLDKQNKPSFYLFDDNGNSRTVIGATSTKDKYGRTIYHPESSIWLFNEKGNGVFNAPQE